MTKRPYFSWASGAAPFVGGLVGLIPMMGQIQLIARVLIGIAIGSAIGMVCAAIAITRRERPWWLWLVGILLNAYPFMFFLLGVSVQLGITRIHL